MKKLAPTSVFILSSFLSTPGLWAAVDVSTVTGASIHYDNPSGVAVVTGSATVTTATGTLKADKIRLNTQKKVGQAEGNVFLEHSSGTIKGSEATYHWETSTGIVLGASGLSEDWAFKANRLEMESKGRYRLFDGGITNCDEDPPHYVFRSKKAKVIQGEKATLKNARLYIGGFPSLYSPYYVQSLKKKKYTLRIEPGHTSRDGVTVKTILGYPFTEYSRTRFIWDYLERTGHKFGIDHDYFHPKARGNFFSELLQDDNPDLAPERRRYIVRWNHYQRVTSRLSLNGEFDFQSDQTFSNDFLGLNNNQARVENATRGITSDGGLRYQFPRASVQVQFFRNDRFDSTVSSESFISKLTLPRVTFNTIPLKWGESPFFSSFNASWVNETENRSDPNTALRYSRSGQVGKSLRAQFRIKRKWTLTPRIGYNQTWRDRTIATNSKEEVFQGKYDTRFDVRRRFFRLVDMTVGHRYQVRLKENRTDADVNADDRGVETNILNTSLVSRFGRGNRITLRSGYDLRSAPRNDPTRYTHTSERITPPSLDLQVEVSPQVTLFFQETYSLFRNGIPVRTPQSTSGEIQIGKLTSKTFFSHGFTYSKTPDGGNARVTFTNKIRFFLTPKWYIDAFLNYAAVGTNRLNYRKLEPTDKSITVIRDLHCWIFRMSFSERNGRTEASFHIDLKTNFKRRNDIFRQRQELPLYGARVPAYTNPFPDSPKPEEKESTE